MRKFSVLFLIFICLLISDAQSASPKHISFIAKINKSSLNKGDTAQILLIMTTDKYWYTYSLKEQLNTEGVGPTPTEITLQSSEKIEILGKIKSPKPLVKYDEGFEIDIEYFKGSNIFTMPIIAKKKWDLIKDGLKVVFYLQLCDTTSCLPPEEFVVNTIFDDAALVEVQSVEVADINDSQESNDTKINDKTSEASDVSNDQVLTESEQEIENQKDKGVFSFLWFAMSAGALALLTPCVFPMVPITVSFFTKRAEKNKGSGLRDSFTYALGIITTFTALGFILALIFGASGIQDFATNPWVNLFIAAIFIVFALNLFGAFEIQVPTSLMNKLNNKSQTGSGITSVLLMGLTFSLTSFTCTVPFVGTALISASSGEWFYPIIGMLGFSTVFAAPFFLLALFPSAMSKLPKAGGWMNNVKVIMGFLEIAAAIKFISNVDLAWALGILPREMFLSIWIGCGLLITLYVIGSFKLPHDSPLQGINATRIMFAIFFASITFFLLSGLQGKNLGELDSFLPPADYQEIIGVSTSSVAINSTENKNNYNQTGISEENWHRNYAEALEEAKSKNLQLFVDFTGVQCTNCRWMEKNMFTRKSVVQRLEKMVLVKLYTDRKIESDILNKEMQRSRFNSVSLPLYVILTPNEEVIGTKEFTRDENEFLKFLDKRLEY